MTTISTLIMAGGSGTRFWPRSREKKPKQFLKIFGNETLIQSTINRFLPLTSKENIFIISKEVQKEEIEKQNLTVPVENILFEPTGKNTLPCIGLASLIMIRQNPDGIIIVTPSDQLIDNHPLFRETIKTAIEIAEKENGFVTIGITPSKPATGFGYIEIESQLKTGNDIAAYKVKQFVEKPNLETALKYVNAKTFFWNSGMFIFKSSVLWDAIKRFSPDIFAALIEIESHIGKPSFNSELNRIYSSIEEISIDYGIMEKADNVYLVKGDFVWNDLGSWEQVYELSEKDASNNATYGEVLLEDTENSCVYTSQGIIAVMGMKDILAVQDGNATLICKRERGEDIKKLVERLRSPELNKYI